MTTFKVGSEAQKRLIVLIADIASHFGQPRPSSTDTPPPPHLLLPEASRGQRPGQIIKSALMT